ncbi:MAG: peptidoglycan bridge formation glycyltransferase FemA/FemB family protein [Patescibacteria group bacterium]|nr:aminoacyltransferase [Patescibacteria group bacterium]
MVKKLNEEQYKQAWQHFGGSPLQSWNWGEVKSYNWRVERVGIFKEGNLVAVLSIHYRKFPLQKFTRFIGLSSFAYIPRGVSVRDIKYLDYVIQELTKCLNERHIAFVLIDPEDDLRFENWNESFKMVLETDGWKVAGETIQPNWTDVIRIDRTEEELFQSVRSKWRRNIRKAVREGVVAKEVEGYEAVDKFYKVIESVKGSTSFKTHPKDYFQRIWDEMSKEDLIKIYVAEYKGEVVAAYLLVLNDYQVYELYGGATKKGRDVEASYLLKWEIIKQQAKAGRNFYDQWGAAPKGDQDHSLFGISYFKSGFGGEHVDMLPQYVKVFRGLGYKLYKWIKDTL